MLQRFCLLCACLLLAGCQALGYYTQAVGGQWSLMGKREPVEHLLADPATEPALRQQLELVVELREFARTELLLPVTGQYTTYADLGRDYAVWNVLVAPEFAVEPLDWCYPVIGCAGYRGYFDQADAQRYADNMASKGFDTWVGGVTTYSTLGWFDDPVLNTFVYRRDWRLADLIFHELAHALLYVPGDTVFNESLATVVATEGVRRWLQAQGKPEPFVRYQQEQRQRETFAALVSNYRRQLDDMYRQPLNDEAKRTRKAELIDAMRRDYAAAKGDAEWLHDDWMALPINNAKLNSAAYYGDLVPALQALLAQSSYRLDEFYARCRELAALDRAERHRQLRILLAAGSGSESN